MPHEVARVPIPTAAGEFEVRAFACEGDLVQLALCRGAINDGVPVLTRLHSECLTGDALGSLRCDCGVQLRVALRRIAAEGRGVLLYATGHEGRGIGLVNKLLAYALQDDGLDTLDANLHLRLPVDGRDYRDSAAILLALGVRSVRLLTNNPDKARALAADGIEVQEIVPVPTAAHTRNVRYLRTKRDRLGHVDPTGSPLGDGVSARSTSSVDVGDLLGAVRPAAERPYVVLKYAQTLDGRIATVTGDSKWISGEDERRVSHALRAACDGVMVGIGTVLQDDPQLTVRMVPGASPLRVVLDSTLQIPAEARVLAPDAPTLILTTARASEDRRTTLSEAGIAVRIVEPAPEGVDLRAALRQLRAAGVRSLLVEGGARVITSLLSARLVDRVIVAIAPRLIGAGTDAVGDLGVRRIADGLPLQSCTAHAVGADVLLAGDLAAAATDLSEQCSVRDRAWV